MAKHAIKSGNIDYTGRAFHQDSTEAMRGDIVRGLIELITNSDDAYASIRDLKSGKITVEVEHRRNQEWSVVVSDRATGMTSADMEKRLARLGGRTSGFESGEARRGNLGRGAKDLAAFGEVAFESIYDDAYSKFLLHPDGSWDLEPPHTAQEKDRNRLGIPRGNGTVVTVRVQAGIRCPQHENLSRRLSSHFQLRDILSDSTRKVELVNLNDGATGPLTYAYPQAKEVHRSEVAIAGYPGVKARLVIWRLAERCDDGAENTGRPSGILVKGKRAIYDNTLFQYEGNLHAGWFTGKIECDHIDSLAKEYDDNLGRERAVDPANPMPIISRRRDGLNREHPFMLALKQAVEGPLGLLVAEESERARSEANSVESDDTKAALSRLARELGRLVNEELREIEAEDLPGDEAGEPPLLAIVPEEVFAYMGEDRTLTIAARKGGVSVGDEVRVDVDPGGVVELLTPTVQLKAHARREDVLVAQVTLRPLIPGEAAMVTATLGSRNAHAMVEVRSPRLTVEEPVVPPETLQFERPAYRVGWLRRKELRVVAPAEVVAACGTELSVSSTDSGIVVRTPQLTLKYDDELDFFCGTVTVEGRALDSAGQVVARAGDLVASAQVKVTRREEGPEFRIELSQEEMGQFRALIESEKQGEHETQVVKVAARHPGILPYLGSAFEGQNSPVVRAMVAEAVADAAARLVVSKLFRSRRNTEAFDVDRFYREHYKRVLKFLPRFQKVLIGEPAVARADEALAPTALLAPQTVPA